MVGPVSNQTNPNGMQTGFNPAFDMKGRLGFKDVNRYQEDTQNKAFNSTEKIGTASTSAVNNLQSRSARAMGYIPPRSPGMADVTTALGQQLFPGGKAGVDLVANIANGIFTGIKKLFSLF